MKIFVLAVIMALGIPLGACLDETGGIEIMEAKAFVLPKQDKGAVSMILKNGGEADKLIGVSSAVAEKAELHNMVMRGPIMQMRPVEGVDLPSGENVTLSPQGYHIMLLGISTDLDRSKAVPLTLTFEKAGEISVDASVIPPAGTAPEHTGADHSGH